MPVFGPGTRLSRVTVNGRETFFRTDNMPHAVQPDVEVALESPFTEVRFHLVPFVEICPPVTCSRPGETDRGLKLIGVEHTDGELIVDCEGLTGQTYDIRVTCPEMITGVSGGDLVSDRIRFRLPESTDSAFIRKTIRIQTSPAG
jgi:hypothetical protein